MKASAALFLSVVLGACCALAAADEPATWAIAHCDCPRDRAIVCGADGTSYLNKCWAECSGTIVKHEGACGKPDADVSACDCDKKRALVCGADGHTYLNKCWAGCVGTDVAYEGACKKVVQVNTCNCPKERALVCGEDGHTYLSECWAECVHTGVAHQGPCTRAVENPPCACTKERTLVCGEDGHTYLNACWAACSGTSVASEGSCKKPPVEDASPASCEASCDKSGYANPVCGTDEKNYPSACAAQCEGVGVEKRSFCKSCRAKFVFAPVCDTEGYTWTNPAELKCAGRELAHDGECGGFIKLPAEVATSCRAACPRGWSAPICGSDGVTYTSECLASCAGADFAKLGFCKKCDASPDFSPVCDTEGFTWANKDYMECANAKFGHDGECEGTSILGSTECQKACRPVFEPVCGMNNKSYANKCRMKCDGVELKHEGRCPITVV